MKKIVRTSLNNVANKRGVRDLNIQLYSHDKNNAGFEFVIKNEVDLSEYKAKVLFDFQESFATWETKGTIEGNVVKVKFDTTFITKCEEVIGYLFLDSETDTLDVFKFKFNVVLSEIDKYDTTKRGFRYIKDQEVVDVITRSELEEEIKKLQVNSGIDLSNYLTTSVANETFATKQELGSYATKDELPSVSGLVTTEQLTAAKNSVVEEISNKGYVTSTVAEETYAKKSDLPAPYNDSALAERVTNLENKTDRDTVYNDTEVKERLATLENKAPVDLSNYATKEELNEVRNSQPTVDTSNLVTKQELEEKHYVTNEQISSTYATKSEIPQPYSDIELVKRITVLENRQDNDTVYDDAELKRRVTALEEKPNVDTSNFVTNEVLDNKGYLTQHQDLSEYALKSELYNDTSLKSRVDAIEYDIHKVSDIENSVNSLKNRVWEVENKLREHDGIDLVFATKDELRVKNDEFNSKFVLKDDLRRLVSEIVTELKSENN